MPRQAFCLRGCAHDLAIIHRRLCTQLCACKRLPTALRRSQEVSARKSQEDPRGASSRQEEPGGRKGTQEEPGKPRRSQGNPGGARRTQEGPGKPRRRQGNPGGARETQEIPRGTMQGESGGTQDDPGRPRTRGTRRDQEGPRIQGTNLGPAPHPWIHGTTTCVLRPCKGYARSTAVLRACVWPCQMGP